MGLLIDHQTQEDLNILGKRGTGSIYSLFNRTHTMGGAEVLESFILFPLNDAAAINSRAQTIRYFREYQTGFPFLAEWFDAAGQYLSQGDERSRLQHRGNNLESRIIRMMGANLEEAQLLKGISALLDIIVQLDVLLNEIIAEHEQGAFGIQCRKVKAILSEPWLKSIIAEAKLHKTDYVKAVEYDGLFRFTHLKEVNSLLGFIYEMDAYIAAASLATQLGLVTAEALDASEHIVDIKGLWHPAVENAVRNDLFIGPEKNIVFLTGANMAGKSTLMKAIGVAMLLAHAGLPVAAEHMRFSVCDGLFTTINLPDDLTNGHSHFYTEVLRVKKMAGLLKDARNLFVIFDELFRGTNVKDAYEGTVAVTAAVAERSNCMLVVSTHIIEAAEALQSGTDKIDYIHLPTLMDQGKPVYTRRIERGISADRHGMTIIRNEGILEMLSNGKK